MGKYKMYVFLTDITYDQNSKLLAHFIEIIPY